MRNRIFNFQFSIFNAPKNKGFTLVELLVSISIFVFMTALVVSRYAAFNQGTLMTNLAYDIALTIRTAQTYGLSVKSANVGTGATTGGNNANNASYGSNFNLAYGVDFSATSTGATNSKSFLIFGHNAPLTGISTYQFSSISALDFIVNTYNISSGAYIPPSTGTLSSGSTVYGICVVQAGSTACTPKDNVDIVFQRPNPDAIICTGNVCANNVEADITVISGDGSSYRKVVVSKTGQISVQD